MKLLRGNQSLAAFDKGVAATIGNFDGVHLGHQKLIKALKIKANQLNIPLVVILFEPQPREFFQKNTAPVRISSLREKLEILKSCDVDYVYCIKFDDTFAKTSAKDFARNYLFTLMKVKYLLIGADFRFGINREGTFSLLQEQALFYNAEVQVAPDFLVAQEKVSSTQIRKAFVCGNLDLAAKCLGRPYSLCGKVIYGDGRGRQWGIPTANINLQKRPLPLHGVFVVRIKIDFKAYYGVANLGKRPTVDGSKNSLEVHLFEFEQQIYGKMIQVFFLHKLRDEIKFSAIDALIAQIHNDFKEAKIFLKSLQLKDLTSG